MCESPKYKRNRFGQLSRCVSLQDAKQIGTHIGIDWETAEFSPEDFQEGIRVELEHGAVDPKTDVTHDDPYATAKIAWAHLLERPDYYQKLLEMERSGMKKPPKSIKYRGARYRRLADSAGRRMPPDVFEELSNAEHSFKMHLEQAEKAYREYISQGAWLASKWGWDAIEDEFNESDQRMRKYLDESYLSEVFKQVFRKLKK